MIQVLICAEIFVLIYAAAGLFRYLTVGRKDPDKQAVPVFIGILGIVCSMFFFLLGICCILDSRDSGAGVLLVAGGIPLVLELLGAWLVGYAWIRNIRVTKQEVLYTGFLGKTKAWPLTEVTRLEERGIYGSLTREYAVFIGDRKAFSIEMENFMAYVQLMQNAAELGNKIPVVSRISEYENGPKAEKGIVESRVNAGGMFLAVLMIAMPVGCLAVLRLGDGLYSAAAVIWLIFGIVYFLYCVTYHVTLNIRQRTLVIRKFFREKTYKIDQYDRKRGTEEESGVQTGIVFYKKNKKCFKVDVSITVTNRSLLIHYLMK